nr:DegV family protein [Oscillospiraceae bacterium]
MRDWRIVADSACDLFQKDVADETADFTTIPFSFQLDETTMTDTEDLDVPTLMDRMERCEKAARTACPSPGDWAAAFAGAKHCVALTISGALSGSLHSAQSGRTLA